MKAKKHKQFYEITPQSHAPRFEKVILIDSNSKNREINEILLRVMSVAKQVKMEE